SSYNDLSATLIYTLSLHDALPIYSDGPLIVFFDGGRGLHVLVGGEWEDVESALEAGGAQDRQDFVLVGQAAIITFVIRQEHVHEDRKSTRLNSSHLGISYAVFCLK